MSLVINTNIAALVAYNALQRNQTAMSTALERLSTGLRINRAADDPAGLAISQGMTAQINGLGQAVRNAQDGINVVQTADGALQETQAILQRMRVLAVQAANDTNSSAARNDISIEIRQLQHEIDRISSATTFNGKPLLDGSYAGQHIQVGPSSHSYDSITVDITSKRGSTSGFDSESLGVGSGELSVMSFGQATSAINTIDDALQAVSTSRAYLGAMQNRFGYSISIDTTMQQNLTQSNSTIMDADMAQEAMNYARASILVQASIFMLRQALHTPNLILALLA
jgi:flagellin